MKVIGQINDSKWIAEFTKDEIQKFQNTYYRGREDLKVGDEIDLGAGYDHAGAIAESVKAMERVIGEVEKITSAVKIGKAIKLKVTKQKVSEATK
jgi:hypothetical protein